MDWSRGLGEGNWGWTGDVLEELGKKRDPDSCHVVLLDKEKSVLQ